MAETQRQTSSKGAGNATDSSLSRLRDHGVSDVLGVSQKINLDDFASKLDSLNGKKTLPGHECAMGKLMRELPESFSSKLMATLINPSVEGTAITKVLADFGFEMSSNVVRRHRRRLQGLDGCKCEK
jgi:hypothetical protein